MALNTGDMGISKQRYECTSKMRHRHNKHLASKYSMKVTQNAGNGISESSHFKISRGACPGHLHEQRPDSPFCCF